VARQAQVVHDRQFSPHELVALYLERIAQLDPVLNAFRVVLAERAMTEAAQVERRLAAGEVLQLRACRSRSKTTPMRRGFRRCAAPRSVWVRRAPTAPLCDAFGRPGW
jgi:hypothetical protein